MHVFAIGVPDKQEILQYDDIDTAIITIKFENGAMAVIDNSRQAAYGYDQRVEVFGNKGMVKCENNTRQNHIVYKDAVIKDKPLYFFWKDIKIIQGLFSSLMPLKQVMKLQLLEKMVLFL